MRAAAILSVVFLLVVACSSGSTGGGSSTGGTGAAEGAACIDYTSCGPGLFCFVFSDAVEGRCDPLPTECNGSTNCDCLNDALKSRCAAARCSARVDRAVYSCPATVRKKKGETCSVARTCEDGTYCKVSTVTRTGTCETLPTACGGGPNCNCLGAEGCGAGGTVRECSVFNDEASLVCE